jgi:hypothetical protein
MISKRFIERGQLNIMNLSKNKWISAHSTERIQNDRQIKVMFNTRRKSFQKLLTLTVLNTFSQEHESIDVDK